MKLIYVASPLSGDVERNLEFARQACCAVMDSGCAFFAPHLLYPNFLDDAIPEQRKLGMDIVTKVEFDASDHITASGCARGPWAAVVGCFST